MSAPSFQPTRVVLLSLSEPGIVDILGRALSLKRCRVVHVPDGCRALEAVNTYCPDLILHDWACPQIAPHKFTAQIRANTRTEGIPIVFIGAPDAATRNTRDLRDVFLPRDVGITRMLGEFDAIFRRTDTACSIKNNSFLEGDLTQMGLPDLLQIFGMNRKTGSLSIEAADTRGVVRIVNGEILDAEARGIRGLKALYRIMGTSGGRFSFTPDVLPGKRTIEGSLEGLLLEGMRQTDEVRRLIEALPEKGGRFRRSGAKPLPAGSPLTLELKVIELLDAEPTLAELLDGCPATDLEVLGALSRLLSDGIAQHALVASSGVRAVAPAAIEPLLDSAALERFKTFQRALQRSLPPRPKILLWASGGALIRQFIRRLQSLPEFTLADRPFPLRIGFGTLGHLAIAPGCSLAIVWAPCNETALPLTGLFTKGAPCGIILTPFFAGQPGIAGTPVPHVDRLPAIPLLHIVVAGTEGIAGADASQAFLDVAGICGRPACHDLKNPAELRLLLRSLLRQCCGASPDVAGHGPGCDPATAHAD